MRIALAVLAAFICVSCQRQSDPLSESLSLPERTVTPPATRPPPSSGRPKPSPEGVFRVSDGVTEPVEISRVDAIIPDDCRESSYTGLFIFEAVIAKDGSIHDVRTLRRGTLNPPCPSVENAFRRAIVQWRYHPGTLNNEPVPVYLTIVVRPSHRR